MEGLADTHVMGEKKAGHLQQTRCIAMTSPALPCRTNIININNRLSLGSFAYGHVVMQQHVSTCSDLPRLPNPCFEV